MEPIPNQEGSVSRLTTLATVMHAGLPKTLASSGYKSQKKNRTLEGEKGRERRGYTEKNKSETA
jgi:hypothetical protein